MIFLNGVRKRSEERTVVGYSRTEDRDRAVVQRLRLRELPPGVSITHWTQTLDHRFLNRYSIIYGQYPCYLWLGSNIAHHWLPLSKRPTQKHADSEK